jgi:hypothetical protein
VATSYRNTIIPKTKTGKKGRIRWTKTRKKALSHPTTQVATPASRTTNINRTKSRKMTRILTERTIMARITSTRKKKQGRQSDSKRDAELRALSRRVGLSSSEEDEASEVSDTPTVCPPAPAVHIKEKGEATSLQQ